MRFRSTIAATVVAASVLCAQNGVPKVADGQHSSLWSPKMGLAPVVTASSNGILYHNGPVMLGTTHIYYIWYGNWSTDATAANILNNFANQIGGSPYFNINTTYSDASSNSVSNLVTFAGSTTNTATKTSLNDADIWSILTTAFTHGMTVDPHGVYFVLTAPGVTETSGFLRQYCGWHASSTYNGTGIQYAFVGNAKGVSLGACAAQPTKSPNNDPAADAMVSVIAHELEESVSDPQLNAWFDNNGEENADKCAWSFGTTYTTSNGSQANMKLGALDYLIQRNWVNANGGSCALSYATGADFGISVSPVSQTVPRGGSMPTYNISLSRTAGLSASVSFQVSGLPSGASLYTAPAATAASSSLFTVKVPATVATGTYALTITGTAGSVTHSANATLIVIAPDFGLSVSPAQTVPQGADTSNYTLTVNATGGFAAPVSFQVAGLPAGASLKSAPAPSATSATFSVTVPLSVTAGSYPLTVTGTSGGLTHTATTTLTVTATKMFTVSASPATLTVSQTSPARATVTVSGAKGFTSPVTLNIGGLPSGASATFANKIIAGTGATTVTIATNANTPKGSAMLTVTATGAGQTSTSTVALTVK